MFFLIKEGRNISEEQSICNKLIQFSKSMNLAKPTMKYKQKEAKDDKVTFKLKSQTKLTVTAETLKEQI